MADASTTCWNAIESAAAGDAAERERFARRYGPVVQETLRLRWRATQREGFVDDAAQEVFLECFRGGGVLEKASPERPGGFRAFLFGVTRNVALRWERAAGRRREERLDSDPDAGGAAAEAQLSRAFDRAWARSLIREAWVLQEARARAKGEASLRRVELLRLRIDDDLPIRDIASRWGADPAALHADYTQARRDFKAALREVVAFHQPHSGRDVDQECRRLLDLVRSD